MRQIVMWPSFLPFSHLKQPNENVVFIDLEEVSKEYGMFYYMCISLPILLYYI